MGPQHGVPSLPQASLQQHHMQKYKKIGTQKYDRQHAGSASASTKEHQTALVTTMTATCVEYLLC